MGLCIPPPTPTPTPRDGGEDADSQGDGSSQPDTISIASRTSQNTVDSDKVGDLETDIVLGSPEKGMLNR